MQADRATIDIRVLGPFRMMAADGRDCTPAGRKTCALMALLALAPDKRRARIWVQNRLWGTRGKDQASASLRQALAELRKALGEDQACLITDKVFLGLDPAAVTVDFDAVALGGVNGDGPGPDLLEGLEIGYEDFDDWLKEQRSFLAARRAPSALAAPAARIDRGPGQKIGRPAQLVFAPFEGTAAVRPGVDSLLDSIGKTVGELGVAAVIDHRIGLAGMGLVGGAETPGDTLSLESALVGSGEGAQVRLVLRDPQAGELVWSTMIEVASLGDPALGNSAVLQQINEAASFAVNRFVTPQGGAPEAWTAATHCQEGIRALFRLGRNNYDLADRLFARAYDLDPRGIYLAWRAYLRTFLIAERQYNCRQTIEDEAFAFLRQAHEKDPHNSYVLALGAHVHTILRRSYMSSFEMAERAVRVNPSNPIGWACLGIAKCHLGQSQDGFRDTQLARSIAGWSPARFQLDALSCIAGSMAGKLDEAIHMGEASHALAPGFAAPMRYLVALHLISGDYERSHDIVQRLKSVEPDFSYDKLREKDYPAAGLQRSTFIKRLPSRQF